VTALDRPKPATGLTVRTTGTSGTVDLNWRHTATKATGGRATTYDLAATPVAGSRIATTVTGRTAAQLTGLDPRAIYTFTVTPRNSAGAGKSSSAVMQRSLAEITGSDQPKTVAAPTAPEPRPAAAPVPAPSIPSAPSAPSTLTIYVCPDGFAEFGGLCRKTLAYTYELAPYTFHSENIYGYGQVDWAYTNGYCTGSGRSGNWPNGDPYCQTPVYGNNAVIGTRMVKDATPAGYVDTGTYWSKRNTAPSGYLDDGTQWVMTVAKVAKVVPA
jgi:hypothetical protein